jgi:hypothetical protein
MKQTTTGAEQMQPRSYSIEVEYEGAWELHDSSDSKDIAIAKARAYAARYGRHTVRIRINY